MLSYVCNSVLVCIDSSLQHLPKNYNYIKDLQWLPELALLQNRPSHWKLRGILPAEHQVVQSGRCVFAESVSGRSQVLSSTIVLVL